MKKDVFICHASEDKAAVVRPLVAELNRAGISCWLDEEQTGWGDSITEKVSKGLQQSRYVIVVLSETFLRKNWPQRELDAMISVEAASGRVRVLPLLVGTITENSRFQEEFPLLADKVFQMWTGDPAPVVQALIRKLRDHPAGGESAQPLLRVGMFSSEYPPRTVGGLGVHVNYLTRSLAEQVEIELVLPPPEQNYATPPTNVRLNPLVSFNPSYEKPTSWLNFAQMAADRLTSLPPVDAIHCHDWVTVLAGIKCRWRQKTPLVYHIHLPNRSPLCASVENLGLVCADVVTVNSEAMREEIRRRPFPVRRIEVVNNGVDTEEFNPGPDWPKDDGYILFVGRLVEQKGVEFLLRAFLHVRQKFPDVRLKIVGAGPYLPWLERLATNLLVHKQVEFPGARKGKDLLELYQRASLVVVPSIYEPFGMTALEAMACQRPVVASNVGGLKSLVTHGVNGFLAETRDHLGLAQWIMTLLADAGLRQRMGQAARLTACRSEYKWSYIAERFVALYRALPKEPDLRIPKEVQELRSQIIRVAKEQSPEMEYSSWKLTDLFDWLPTA